MLTDLILGGGGFIGRHVGLSLARKGRRVRLLGRRENGGIRSHLCENLSYEVSDIRFADWDRLLDGVDVVHHYAWSTVPQTSDVDPVEDLDSNVRTVVALLQAIRRRKAVRLVFASSGGTVYGRAGALPISEDSELEPVSLYGAAKVAAEQYISVYRRAHGVDCRVARLSNPFGAGQRLDLNQGAATSFTYKAMSGEPIHIFGDGSVVRDYIHISDVVAGLVALGTLPLEPAAPFVYNLGSGTGTSLNTLLHEISRLLDKTIAVEHSPNRSFDIPFNVLDTNRASRCLKWHALLDLPSGLALMINDYLLGKRLFSSLG